MKLLRRSDGNAMIELSLVLPILILMLLGVVDIGMVITQAIAVVDCARAGAEYATTYGNSANVNAMQTYAHNSALSIPNYSSLNFQVPLPVVTCSCTAGGTGASCTGTCPGGVAPIQYAQVTVTATLPLIIGVAGFPVSIPVKSVAKVRTAWTAGS